MSLRTASMSNFGLTVERDADGHVFKYTIVLAS